MDNNVSDIDNPWAVKTVEEFRLYCCPECDGKYRESKEFQSHATIQHPLSAILFEQSLKLAIDDKDSKNYEDPAWQPETQIKEESDYGLEDQENYALDDYYDEDFELKPLKKAKRRKRKAVKKVKNEDSKEDDFDNDKLFSMGSDTVTVVNNDGETIDIQKETFKCPKCDLTSWSYLILCRHLHGQHRRSDSMYECPACPNLFNTLQETRGHIKANHKLPCPVCHKQVSDLSGHFARTHPVDRDMKKFKCAECQFATHRNSLLSQHVFVNHRKDEHKFKCLECEKKFPTKFLLNQHCEVKHTDPDGRRYVCDKCGKAFAVRHFPDFY